MSLEYGIVCSWFYGQICPRFVGFVANFRANQEHSNVLMVITPQCRTLTGNMVCVCAGVCVSDCMHILKREQQCLCEWMFITMSVCVLITVYVCVCMCVFITLCVCVSYLMRRVSLHRSCHKQLPATALQSSSAPVTYIARHYIKTR